MKLAMENVSYQYGELEVLREVDFHVRPGEFLVVIGPSGCGKSTLLTLLAGYTAPAFGQVLRSAKSRMIHQQGGLFPWYTVRENIVLGGGGTSDWIRLLGLEGFEEAYPHQLSGGMRQRVELARALAGEPDTLLLDEPFSALDYQTRARMRNELRAALDKRPRTVVLVTHDIEDAVVLGDRVLVLSPRPARVENELVLDWEHPRDPGDPRMIAAVKDLRSQLRLD